MPSVDTDHSHRNGERSRARIVGGKHDKAVQPVRKANRMGKDNVVQLEQHSVALIHSRLFQGRKE